MKPLQQANLFGTTDPLESIMLALSLGARVYGNVSGGKDGQAMVRTLINNQIPVEALLHCDLGRVEWPQSMAMCRRQSEEYKLPLHILTRRDGLDLLAYWQRRMAVLAGTGKPFWSSAQNRYCTSDLKRGPSDMFYRNCGHGLIISAEGIRAEESAARAKKEPLSIRKTVTSAYYAGMSVEQALVAYRPDKRLVLNWYPIFNMSIGEVWETYDMSIGALKHAKECYTYSGVVPSWWPFHPAYAMGNERVSCMICILGSPGDIRNGIKHNPELHREMAGMELASGCSFRQNLTLHSITV